MSSYLNSTSTTGRTLTTTASNVPDVLNEVVFYDITVSKDGIDFNSITIGGENNFHIVIRANNWFAMRSKGEYSLIGCTVAPGFDYADFELAPKDWKPKNFTIDFN